jgi:hypothetical protein
LVQQLEGPYLVRGIGLLLLLLELHELDRFLAFLGRHALPGCNGLTLALFALSTFIAELAPK